MDRHPAPASPTSDKLSAFESIVSSLEQQEMVTASDIQGCIGKLVSTSVQASEIHKCTLIFLYQRMSMRGLCDLKKHNWISLYEIGIR